jgi:hypothetical protein
LFYLEPLTHNYKYIGFLKNLYLINKNSIFVKNIFMGKIEVDVSPCYLEPIEHVYIHRATGDKFSSVTKAITSIEPHFDAEAVASAIVRQSDNVKQERYIGMSKIQILDYWQMLNDEANTYGTFVHDVVERYLKAKKWWFPDDDLSKKVIAGYNELKIDEGIRMQPERIMFSEEYKLAGMSDLIVDIDPVWFDVGDWKTNRIFNFYNPYGFETLLKPFDHLQNCQWSIYTLQLSVYALMYMLETGKRCRHIWVGYWNKETETFTKIPIMFLMKEAKQLLELHKYNLLRG